MDNPSHIDGSRSFRLPTSSFRPPTSSFRRKPESRGQRGGKKLHSNVSNNQPHFHTLVCRRQPARAIAMKACPGLRSGIDGPHRRPVVSPSPSMGKDWGEGEPRSAEACPQASARRRPIFILLCGLRKAIGDSGESMPRTPRYGARIQRRGMRLANEELHLDPTFHRIPSISIYAKICWFVPTFPYTSARPKHADEARTTISEGTECRNRSTII